jgi:hypothetical protein
MIPSLRQGARGGVQGAGGEVGGTPTGLGEPVPEEARHVKTASLQAPLRQNSHALREHHDP